MGSLEAQFLDLQLGFGLSGQAGDMLDLKLLASEGWDVYPCIPASVASHLRDGCPLAVMMLLCSDLSLTRGGGVSLCSTYRCFG